MDILKTKTLRGIEFTLAKTSENMATVSQKKDGQEVTIFAGDLTDCKQVFKMLGKNADSFKFDLSTGDSTPR